MEIPSVIFLAIFGLLTLLAVVFMLFNIYHMFRFGQFDKTSALSTAIFAGGFVVILFISILFFLRINWSGSVEVFGGGNTFINSQDPSTDFSL